MSISFTNYLNYEKWMSIYIIVIYQKTLKKHMKQKEYGNQFVKTLNGNSLKVFNYIVLNNILLIIKF